MSMTIAYKLSIPGEDDRIGHIYLDYVGMGSIGDRIDNLLQDMDGEYPEAFELTLIGV